MERNRQQITGLNQNWPDWPQTDHNKGTSIQSELKQTNNRNRALVRTGQNHFKAKGTSPEAGSEPTRLIHVNETRPKQTIAKWIVTLPVLVLAAMETPLCVFLCIRVCMCVCIVSMLTAFQIDWSLKGLQLKLMRTLKDQTWPQWSSPPALTLMLRPFWRSEWSLTLVTFLTIVTFVILIFDLIVSYQDDFKVIQRCSIEVLLISVSRNCCIVHFLYYCTLFVLCTFTAYFFIMCL